MRHDENDSFVNRHGRKSAITSTELEELSIDNQPVESFEPEPASEKSSVSRPRIAWTRRKILIVIGIVLALLLLPVIGGEIIGARYRAAASGVPAEVSQLVKSDVLPAQKKATIKSTALAAITTKVDTIRSSMCDGGLVDNLATLYPRANSAHSQCVARSGQLAQLSSALKRLENETRYIEAITAATKTVTAPLTEPYAVVSAQQENWQATRDSIRKISPPTEWQSTHKSLGDQAAAVADNWSKLNTAQNAQDKTGFEQAEKGLTDSYEAIRNSITALQGELKVTQESLSAAYSPLKQ